MNVFTDTFDQFNASLLKVVISFFIAQNLLNGSIFDVK